MEEREREHLASVFTGMSHPTRIAVLEVLAEEQPLSTVVEELDVTRGTVQDHVETLIDSDLVYRPSEEGRTYAVTPLGEHVLQLLDTEAGSIVAAVDRIVEAREDQRQEVEPAVELVDEIDEVEWERTINTRAWEGVMDDIEVFLKG